MYTVIGRIEGKYRIINKEPLDIDGARALAYSDAAGQEPRVVPYARVERALAVANGE